MEKVVQKKKVLALAVTILLSTVFLLPLTASAAGWSSPFAIGTGGLKPSVAIDSQGNIHYAWYDNGSNVIQYRQCTGLSANTCDSIENLPAPSDSYYPSIAIDRNDRPNVVWEAKDPNPHYSVYFSRRGNQGWSNPVKVSSETYSELPDIAIGPNGLIHIIYQSKSLDGTQGFIYYAESSDGVNFGGPLALSQIHVAAPLPTMAEFSKGLTNAPSGQQLAEGFYPRISVNSSDEAFGVWQNPTTPYGVVMRHQTGSGWSNPVTVGSGHKDETPDISINSSDIIGIVWTAYDAAQIAFAEYDGNTQDFKQIDVDGGLANSYWPKISADCNGNFHLAYQSGNNSDWDIYHRSYNPNNNSFGSVDTIAKSGFSEQTPAIDTTSIGAIVYTNSSDSIIDVSTKNLGITCGPGGPPNTPTETLTPTLTNTPNPNATATPTLPAACAQAHIPNKSSCITYRNSWIAYSNAGASDGNYERCDNGTRCHKASAAKIIVPDSFAQVQLETARSSTYGKINIWINDIKTDSIDLCNGNDGAAPTFFKTQKYTVPPRTDGTGLPRTFEVGAGRTSPCSPYTANYGVVDGFDLFP